MWCASNARRWKHQIGFTTKLFRTKGVQHHVSARKVCLYICENPPVLNGVFTYMLCPALSARQKDSEREVEPRKI